MTKQLVIIGLFFTIVQILSVHANGVHVKNKLEDVDITCNSDNILVTVSSKYEFSGMIYPKGLLRNSSCLAEYEHAGSTITYKLPLRSCGTMTHDVTNGIEYVNTIVIEPHEKLVTKHGKGFHVRCLYETKDKAISNGANSVGLSPIQDLPPLPLVSMKIFVGRPNEHRLAEHVKIGDYISIVISIEEQSHFGFYVTNCVVKDGLNLAEEPLINNEGCAIDEEIFGHFEYNKNLTSAFVVFPAHKFPLNSVVYYACRVKLCNKKNGGCDDVPPICDETGHNVGRIKKRLKRQTNIEDRGSLRDLQLEDEDLKDRSVEVYSGVFVDEEAEEENVPSSLSTRSDDDFCISSRKFAIGISIAGIILLLAVILLVACIVHRRRRKGSSTTGSSIYSGPYSNHAYSRD